MAEINGFTCPRCGSPDVVAIMNVIVQVPFDDMGIDLSKKGIRSRKVKIIGVDREHPTFICYGCGWNPQVYGWTPETKKGKA
jgi:transcription elongation factor Elf1